MVTVDFLESNNAVGSQVAGSFFQHEAFNVLQLQTVTSGAAIEYWQGVCIVFVCVGVCNCSLGQPYPPAKKKQKNIIKYALKVLGLGVKKR